MSKREVPFVFLVAFAFVALGGSVSVADEPESSDVCGTCHQDIYRMWKDSAHAKALEDPFFLVPLRKISSEFGSGSTQVCIGCHAPMAAVTNDPDLEKAITWEGVNCEFCHGLAGVEIEDGNPRHVLDIGPVKRGTIPGADSRGHDVEYSELHTEALVCAPCHEHTTDAGVAIMTTYTEWRDSSAAERGEPCQSCHMNLVDSNVVDPRIKRDSGAKVNLHEVPGGNSLQQLHKALRVTLNCERGEDGLELETVIRNIGAGHAVPTGMPGRRIILEVEVLTSDGEAYAAERVYEKLFVKGPDAERVDHVVDLFVEPELRLESDTRIAPDETRIESFVFPVPESSSATVHVRMRYEHSPWGQDQEKVSTTFISEKRFVRKAS